MEQVLALALCLVFSLSSATSPPKSPTLIPLNCNETKHQVGLAADLINEDRDEGFVIRPYRTKSIFEQRVETVDGSSLYYIDFEAKETKCSVLSGKKWKDCNQDIPEHDQVTGECKAIIYISRPWRILKVLNYNCTLGTVPSAKIVSRCPDCPVIVTNITPKIKEKTNRLVEKFNQDSNQTNLFKLHEIERVKTQWVFGQSYFIDFTIEETVCLKTQKDVILDNCNSLKDDKAHVGFCTGSTYTKPDQTEEYVVSCEIYDSRDDDHHHHHHHHHTHGQCKHEKGGVQGEEVKDHVEPGTGEAATGGAATGEAGAEQKEQSKDLPEKCELGKGTHCGRHIGHRHRCHPHHPGHHHHHHHHSHDQQKHSHPHDPADHHHHDHHNHTSAEHGSSSEERTDKQPFKRTKGSVHVYYLDSNTPSPPVPTIIRVPRPGKRTPETADFPNEPSPLETCPSSQW